MSENNKQQDSSKKDQNKKVTQKHTKINEQKIENKQPQKLLNEINIDGKKLGLVFFQVAKQEDSLFNDDQKFKIRAPFVGIFLSLGSATMVNIAQILIKPQQKKRKWFLFFGLGNIALSVGLTVYTLYHSSELYKKIPQNEWNRIKQQKEKYEKLSFSQRKQIIKQQIEKQQRKQLQKKLQQQKRKRQQRIDLAK